MRAFESYQEAKKEHVGNASAEELLRSTYLQGAWAEVKAASIEDDKEREMAVIDWMSESGEWFRNNILEHGEEVGGKSRKEYFLNLFDHDPDTAVRELDQLFKESQH